MLERGTLPKYRQVSRPSFFPANESRKENPLVQITYVLRAFNFRLACNSLRRSGKEYEARDKLKEETAMVHATIRMTMPPKRRGEVLEIISSLAERSRFEPGCISCRVYQDVEIEPGIMLEQLWMSGEDLERHLRSEEFRKILLVMEMSLDPPEIRFDEISGSSGVETIEKARNARSAWR